MIGSLAIMLLGATASATPCESVASLKLDKASITSAQMVAEGPAPARGRGRGAPAAPPGNAQARGGGAPNTARGNAPPAMIPEHCRLQLVLTPSSDSHIEMEMWLPPLDKWNGKFMGVGNGGFAGSIQGLTNEMPQALRLVIPVKYGIKNIKRIGRIEFADKRPVDYWAEQGYDWFAGL